jgi:hypothetical protein
MFENFELISREDRRKRIAVIKLRVNKRMGNSEGSITVV